MGPLLRLPRRGIYDKPVLDVIVPAQVEMGLRHRGGLGREVQHAGWLSTGTTCADLRARHHDDSQLAAVPAPLSSLAPSAPWSSCTISC
ncbi:hypothetical protein M8818_001445 [Zalaria obscura]|uniref:Uncharacterized protein n=1 Tax=Zalaria obscura TaxID=2024903 RepID=A0ACC3SMY4_9PEZI